CQPPRRVSNPPTDARAPAERRKPSGDIPSAKISHGNRRACALPLPQTLANKPPVPPYCCSIVKTLAKPVAPQEEVQELLRLQAGLRVFRADLPVHDWPDARIRSLRSGSMISHSPRSFGSLNSPSG